MELVLAHSGPEDPRANLESALQEFEQVLSSEEKNKFRTQATPDTLAAVKLASVIDNTGDRSRCVSTRLMTFLESVQQFSTIVDTFVSARPDIAALVWGGVKFAISAAINALTYFDKLSQLFMRLGKTCPRYNEFSLLYPSSKRLQGALCDYYAVVVRLSKHITLSSRKTAFMRQSLAIIFPFETEFGPYVTKLERLSNDVYKEISLASKQAQKEENELQAKERQEAKFARQTLARIFSRHDEDAKKLQMERDRRRVEERRLRSLKSFSTYDYQKSFKQVRRECVPGTSTWICENPDFQLWVEGSVKNIWCTGRIGTGKSIISASVITYMMETGYTTAYFFCTYDDQESLKATTLFGSIVRQLANALPAHAFSGYDYLNTKPRSILKFLESTLDRKQRYFIIIDGFDECEKDQLKEIYEIFVKLIGSSALQFSIYFSSRPNIKGWPLLKVQVDKHIDLETPANQTMITDDIRKFISISLEEKLAGEIPELQLSDSELILVIVDRLEKEAQGMFLWVKFQIQALCEEKSDSQILAALDDLPPDLPKTFDRILSRAIRRNDSKLMKRIFGWLVVARRPLSLEELREAVGIEPFQDSWDERKLVNDMKTVVAGSGNLLFVDEEQQTVHFTHKSVKQYLLSHDITESLRDYHINFGRADTEAGVTCVTYLSLPVFKTQVERKEKSTAQVAGLPSLVIQRSLGRPTGNSVALDLLLNRKQHPSEAIDRQLRKTSQDSRAAYQRNIPTQYSFLSYAKDCWLEHTKHDITPTSGNIWTLWCTLLEQADQRDLLSGTLWDIEDWQCRNPKIIRWVAANDHCTLAHLIVQSRGMPDISANDLPEEKTDAMSPEWHEAWRKGTTRNQLYDILVAEAAAKGHRELVWICLDSGSVPQESLGLALYSAANGGYLDIVQRLLSMGADVNAIVKGYGGGTALQAAAASGHLLIMEMLLQQNAMVYTNSDGVNGRSALQAAAGNGHLAVVERLLQAKADVEATGEDFSGQTPLGAAARSGHLLIVERLLRANANVNARIDYTDSGRTPLQAAAEGGSLSVIERLLALGAEVNAPAVDSSGLTALQGAAKAGHLAAVRRLLQAKAEVNAPPGKHCGHTALQGAARGGHLAIVETLLQEGADVNAPASERYGGTALRFASDGGHAAIVEKLRAAGARDEAQVDTLIEIPGINS